MRRKQKSDLELNWLCLEAEREEIPSERRRDRQTDREREREREKKKQKQKQEDKRMNLPDAAAAIQEPRRNVGWKSHSKVKKRDEPQQSAITSN